MDRVSVQEIDFMDDYRYCYRGLPFSGTAFETDSNGRLIAEMEFHDGMQHGKSGVFYPSGQLQREASYRYNTLHGVVSEWNINGTVELVEEYELGVCVSRSITDGSGVLRLSYQLREGDSQFEILLMLRKAKIFPPEETA